MKRTNKCHPAATRKSAAGPETKLTLPANLVRGGSVCLALIILFALAAGCASSTGATQPEQGTSGTTLVAVRTQAPPAVDGKMGEDAWAQAKPVTVSLKPEAGVEPREITLRALYDDENVYLSASYKDATPLKIGEAWSYDGTSWTKGAHDDTLGLVWDIDKSLPAFDKQGFGVMTTPLRNGLDVFDFKLDNPTGQLSHAKLDFWGWCGLPEFYGRGDDMIFKMSVKPGEKALLIQHDAYPNGKPWVKNETAIGNKTVPVYKYKAGLDLDNTPRPYLEDVELITDYTSFKPGDRAPFVVGIRGATWGGSKDDIITKGVNDNGVWTIEFARKRDTGYPDDVVLVVGVETAFAAIVRDDGKGYALSGPVILRFE